jgi:hypothetical protein
VNVDEVLARVLAALDLAGVPYMVTGSFASSLHGEPRATKDIDIVIAPSHSQLLELVRQFPEDRYYASEEDALQALAHRSMFNVIDFLSGWKVDFILRKSRPFSEEEFSRRRTVEIANVPLVVATAEDILIAKLEWARMGESERQIDDAASILRVQGTALDTAYVERWVHELELEEQWKAAKARAYQV